MPAQGPEPNNSAEEVDPSFFECEDVPKETMKFIDFLKTEAQAQKVHFLNPHPGLAGCPTPIPEEVREVANYLDGKTLSLGDAYKLIKSACPLGLVRVHQSHNYIGLQVNIDDSTKELTEHEWWSNMRTMRVNAWKVIDFTNLKIVKDES